jgi:heme exporter protein B
MSAILAAFQRDFALHWNGGAGALAPLGYFLGAALASALALGPERDLLQAAGPPLVWVAAALTTLATLERLFQADIEDGSLDQMLLSPAPLEGLVLAKGAALWCALGLPLSLAAAPAALALQAPPERIGAIVLSIALGMCAFIGAGLVAASVAAGVRRGGPLIALLVLPFYAPPIIFGAAAASQSDAAGALFILSGCALGSAALGPIAAAAALRLQAE